MDNPACNSSQMELTSFSQAEGDDVTDVGIKEQFTHTSTPNMYVVKRNFIHQLMDVALLMANVSQLKALLSMDSQDKYFYLLLCFIAMSILLQIVFTICMLAIWSLEKPPSPPDDDAEQGKELPKVTDEQAKRIRRKQQMAEKLDRVGNVLVLMIIVANVFITAFGVESHSVLPAATDTQTSVTIQPAS